VTAKLRPSTAVPPGNADPGTRLSAAFSKAALADEIAKHARTRDLVASRAKVPLVMELLTWYHCALRLPFPATSILRQSPRKSP